MKIDEKSISELQISMNLGQELLSYIELGYNGYRAPNCTAVCFTRSFGCKKKVFIKYRSELVEVGRNWSKKEF